MTFTYQRSDFEKSGVSPVTTSCVIEMRAMHWRLDTCAWRKHKSKLVRVVPVVVRNRIAIARVASSSLLSNTCCTSLLLQGAFPP
jgi:hypothetical protein